MSAPAASPNLAWERAVVFLRFALLGAGVACGTLAGAGLEAPARLMVLAAPILAAGGVAWLCGARDDQAGASRMVRQLDAFRPGPWGLAVLGMTVGMAMGQALLQPLQAGLWPMLALGFGANVGSFLLLARQLRRFAPEADLVRP